MSEHVDPLYGPDITPPTEEDALDYPHSLSEAVIAEQLERLARKAPARQTKRAPRDRQLKAPWRDR